MKLDDLRDLMPGDQLAVRDGHRNIIAGQVEHIGASWVIEAFNTKIEIARDKTLGVGPRIIGGLHIMEWTSQLINETEARS